MKRLILQTALFENEVSRACPKHGHDFSPKSDPLEAEISNRIDPGKQANRP